MDFKLTELATNPRMAGRREGGREVWGGRAAGVGFGRGGAGGGAGGRGRGGRGGRGGRLRGVEGRRTGPSQQGSTQETPCSVTTAS